MTSARATLSSSSIEPALDKALALAGGMVLGVLGQIAMVARLGDGADDRRPIDRLRRFISSCSRA